MPATPLPAAGLPADWVEHRRDDGERLGWIFPSGAHYTAVDVLGRTVAADVEWLDADWGAAAAVGAGMLERSLPWPAPAELQVWSSRANI